MRLRCPRRGPLIFTGLAVAAAAIACAGGLASDEPDGSLIVTQVPAGAGRAGLGARLDLAERFPEGSRIIWVRSSQRRGQERVLSGGFSAAGAPDLSPGADRVLFAGRRKPDDNWAIYEVRVAAGRPTLVVDTGSDCVDPAYLAGDRLVFTCRQAAERSVAGDASWSLYTARRDGSDIDRITWGPGSAFDPTPLPDGRLLFSMWQGAGVGRSRDGSVALFTTNPDGTLLEPLAGSHQPPWLKARARPTADSGVVFLASDRRGGPSRLERLEMGRPQDSRHRLDLDLDLLSVEPDGGEFLITTASGVYRWNPQGSALETVFDDPRWDEVEALPRRPGPTPKNLPSPMVPSMTTGTLICYDARRSDRRVGPPVDSPRPAAVEVVLWVGLPEPNGTTSLARFPVETDGSFQIEVPADQPLRVRTLDPMGSEISESEWFWVRPGEVRACFGCHENRQAAPVNRAVEALTTGPAEPLTRLEGEG